MKHLKIFLGAALILVAHSYSNTKPNFLFLLVDDLGWADIGAYNPGTFYETPNVDTLAMQGMKFTNGYAAHPVCSPTRSALMAGINPARNDLTQWIGGDANPPYAQELSLKDSTIAEVLKGHGYKTFFAGKWHLGEVEKYWPHNRGFETNIGGWARGSPKGGYFGPYENPMLTSLAKGEHLPYRLTDESMKFLESMKDSKDPFFLYLSFYSVHTPFQTTNELNNKYKAKAAKLPKIKDAHKPFYGKNLKLRQDHPKYAGMMESMDVNVGRILKKLKDLGLDSNTVVVFTSDNGGFSTVGSYSATSNLPLNGGKGFNYEGGIRVPFIIKWPGVVKPDSTDALAVSMDFFPTFLEMAGLPLRPNLHKDGKSLVPVLKKQVSQVHTTLYWHYPHIHGSGHKPSSAIRVGDYKLINFYEKNKNRIEMYDLSKDIGEQKDLSESMPAKRDSILGMLHKFWTDTDAKFPKNYKKIPNITEISAPEPPKPVSIKPLKHASSLIPIVQNIKGNLVIRNKGQVSRVDVQVHSVSGTRVGSFSLVGNKPHVLSHLKSGAYLLKFSGGSLQVSKRAVIL